VNALHRTGQYRVYFAYWKRLGSSVAIPFSSALPPERFLQLPLIDPRGNPVRRALLSLKFTWWVRKTIGRLNPDLIYAVNLDSLAVAYLAMFRKSRVGLYYDMQDQMGDHLNWPFRKLYGALMQRVDGFSIESEGFRPHLETNQIGRPGLSAVHVANAPGGWTATHIPHSDRSHLVVGYVGNMRGAEQIDTLLEATKRVRATGRDVRLHFGGVGPEAPRLHEMSLRENYVEFSGPFDYAKEYTDLFFKADIVYAVYPQSLPVYRTHIARRFHEAALSGLPIIVCRDTHMAREIREVGGGFEVGETSVEDLERVLIDAYDNRVRLHGMTISDEHKARYRFETYEPAFLRSVQLAIDSRAK
jgi:glycosyltransferase involved in cell wall biosynthesis